MPGDALGQDPAELRRRIDATKAHPARVYDVFLGGKDNYPVDRAAAARCLADRDLDAHVARVAGG